MDFFLDRTKGVLLEDNVAINEKPSERFSDNDLFTGTTYLMTRGTGTDPLTEIAIPAPYDRIVLTVREDGNLAADALFEATFDTSVTSPQRYTGSVNLRTQAIQDRIIDAGVASMNILMDFVLVDATDDNRETVVAQWPGVLYRTVYRGSSSVELRAAFPTSTSTAGRAPTVNDDILLGHGVNSIWTHASITYILQDNTAGAAVWAPIVEGVSVGGGEVLYVDATNGDDTNNGSFNNPYATVNQALSSTGANDTVVVWPGTYDETNLWPSGANVSMHLTQGARIDYTGTTGNGVIHDAAAGTTFRIFGQGESSVIEQAGNTGGNRACVSLTGASTLTVEGVRCTSNAIGHRIAGAATLSYRDVGTTSSDGCYDLLAAATLDLYDCEGHNTNDGFCIELDHASAVARVFGGRFTTGDSPNLDGSDGTGVLAGAEFVNSSNDNNCNAGTLNLYIAGCRFDNTGAGGNLAGGTGEVRISGCQGSGTDGIMELSGDVDVIFNHGKSVSVDSSNAYQFDGSDVISSPTGSNLKIADTGDTASLTFDTGRITAGSGDTVDADMIDVRDTGLRIQDNADPTKELAFECSGIATGTTRTLTVPDKDGTVMTEVSDDGTPTLGGNLDASGNDVSAVGTLDFNNASELTISSGSVTPTQTLHTVDTESDASTDDLTTIVGGADGQILILRPENAARTVVVKHGSGLKLIREEDYTMSDVEHTLVLMYNVDSLAWTEIVRSHPTPLYIEEIVSSHTLSASECFGAVYYAPSAVTITLPAVADGMSLTVITDAAVAVSVKADASDLISLDGTDLDDGDKITNSSTAGDTVFLAYRDASGWFAVSDGQWTDDGP